MKTTRYSIPLVALALAMLALPQTSLAADDLESKTLSDWTFNKALSGAEPTEAYLRGKVVVLEYWGVQ